MSEEKPKWKTIRTIHILPYQDFNVRRGKAGMIHIDIKQKERVLDKSKSDMHNAGDT